MIFSRRVRRARLPDHSTLCIGGDEAAHGLIDAICAKATLAISKRTIRIHPTVAELTPTILQGIEILGP